MNDLCARCGAGFEAGDRFCAKCGAPRGAADAAPKAPAPSNGGASGSKVGATILVAIFPLLAIGGAVLAGGDCSGSAEGSFAIRGGPHGDFTLTPTDCHSLQPYGRFGANLHGDGPNDGAVYVTMDHRHGMAVEVEVPGSCRNANGTNCTVFELPLERCSTYDASVDFNGVVVNDVRLVEGHVRVDCALEDGTAVRGSITFDGC